MTDGQFNRGFILMLIAMAVLTVLLMVIAVFASSDVNERLDAQAELENSDAIASRISPVGEFAAQLQRSLLLKLQKCLATKFTIMPAQRVMVLASLVRQPLVMQHSGLLA